jgi:ubiquinone/menaquinone biosynthesis C-methylase UbiE
MRKILDLGCGNSKRPGAIGVDFNSRTAADVIHDLNRFPYPFEDSSFDEVYLDNSLEHLDSVISTMEEVYRVLKCGGVVKVIVPYFRSLWAFGDVTHRHYFTVRSFEMFDINSPIAKRYDYTQARFLIEKIVFNETLRNSFFKNQFLKIANRWPLGYEYYLSHLYPLDDLSYYLRKP